MFSLSHIRRANISKKLLERFRKKISWWLEIDFNQLVVSESDSKETLFKLNEKNADKIKKIENILGEKTQKNILKFEKKITAEQTEFIISDCDPSKILEVYALDFDDVLNKKSTKGVAKGVLAEPAYIKSNLNFPELTKAAIEAVDKRGDYICIASHVDHTEPGSGLKGKALIERYLQVLLGNDWRDFIINIEAFVRKNGYEYRATKVPHLQENQRIINDLEGMPVIVDNQQMTLLDDADCNNISAQQASYKVKKVLEDNDEHLTILFANDILFQQIKKQISSEQSVFRRSAPVVNIPSLKRTVSQKQLFPFNANNEENETQDNSVINPDSKRQKTTRQETLLVLPVVIQQGNADNQSDEQAPVDLKQENNQSSQGKSFVLQYQ